MCFSCFPVADGLYHSTRQTCGSGGRCLQTVPVLDVQRSGNKLGAACLEAAPGSAPGVTVSFNLGSVCTVYCNLVLRY